MDESSKFRGGGPGYRAQETSNVNNEKMLINNRKSTIGRIIYGLSNDLSTMGSLGMVNFPRSMKKTSANSFFCSGVQHSASSAKASKDDLNIVSHWDMGVILFMENSL